MKALSGLSHILEEVDHKKEYFLIRYDMNAFKSSIYLFPEINIELLRSLQNCIHFSILITYLTNMYVFLVNSQNDS